jgi:succinate-semialdehyde dehydrogenase/glutarate-semialdehyde dehydrogenase
VSDHAAGQFVAQHGTGVEMAIASVNPATGEILKTFDELSAEQLAARLDLAAAAFAEHRNTSFTYRAERMLKAAEIFEAEKETFGRLMSLEMGKPIQAAIDEAVKSASACRYYAEQAERFLADEVVETSASRSYVCYQPLGPVLAIMPWNYPFWQVVRFVAPALMAGNVGLLKHASNVPQSALAVEDVFLRAGFPVGVFQTLLVGSSRVDEILGDRRIVAATLTGSEGAGIQVGISAAKHIKKVVLELGGSDPFIVMRSANFDDAVAAAVKARVANNGQSCIAAKRFLVEESIADRFEVEFVRRMETLTVGDPLDPKTELGPLASASAVDDLHRDVQKSIDAGARLLTGGKPLARKGCFYPPTVLTDIPRESPAYNEEFFGPVASVFRIKDAEEAIKIANDTRFGLGASVWTQNEQERVQFIRGLEAGMVFVNKMVASDPRVPFGGVKQSGFGRELGPFGIREFTNIKTVWIEK